MKRTLRFSLFALSTFAESTSAQSSRSLSCIDAKGNQAALSFAIFDNAIDTDPPASDANQAVTQLMIENSCIPTANFAPIGPSGKITYPDIDIDGATVYDQQALLNPGPNQTLAGFEQWFLASSLNNFSQTVVTAATPSIESQTSDNTKDDILTAEVWGGVAGSVLLLGLLALIMNRFCEKSQAEQPLLHQQQHAVSRAEAGETTQALASAPPQAEGEEGEPGTGRAPGQRCSIQ